MRRKIGFHQIPVEIVKKNSQIKESAFEAMHFAY